MKHYIIYQVDMKSPKGARIKFRSYDSIKREGTELTLDAYKKVYEGDIEENNESVLPLVEQLFVKFNLSRPEDFKGHSLSVSDIIVIDGQLYFCDKYSFRAISISASEPGHDMNQLNKYQNVV